MKAEEIESKKPQHEHNKRFLCKKNVTWYSLHEYKTNGFLIKLYETTMGPNQSEL